MNRMSCLVIFAAVCLVAGAASACRYNVRDVGFVDLGIDTCILFALIDNETSPAVIEDLKAVVSEKLEDTGLRAELVNTAADPAHPAGELARTAGIASRPAALFVAPDGRSRTVELAAEAAAFRIALATQLDALVSSPLRRQIAEACARSYGVVLVIEGLDADQNASARSAAEAAVKLIAEHIDFLPKPIAEGPVTMTLARSAFKQEELLLWCLNLEPGKILRPHAVIFYGRARQIGPVLKGEEVTENIITNILALIGADCECGLDRRWMEGPLLPAQWPAETRARLVESLGFDPDSPMVKMEVSMILRQGPMSPGRFDVAGLGAAPYGYQEIVVDLEEANAPAEAPAPPPVSPGKESIELPTASGNAPPPMDDAGETLSLWVILAVLTAFGAVVVLIGIFILWRARLRA
jgi:hypothetical protein